MFVFEDFACVFGSVCVVVVLVGLVGAVCVLVGGEGSVDEGVDDCDVDEVGDEGGVVLVGLVGVVCVLFGDEEGVVVFCNVVCL